MITKQAQFDLSGRNTFRMRVKCALMGGQDTIRDYIAFPKNNQGRDVMIDSPSQIDQEQLDELQIDVRLPQNAQ